MKKPLKFIVLLIVLQIAQFVKSQNIYIPSTGMPSEVVACGEPASFKFKVFGPLALGAKIRIDLPVGAEFTELIANQTTASVDNTDPQHPIITMETALATASDFKLIKYTAITGCNPMATDAKIVYTLVGTSVTAQAAFPSVLYSSIEISTVAPAAASLNVGQVQNTTLSLVQNTAYVGAYATTIIVNITHSTNVVVTYTDTATSSLVLGTSANGMQTDILTLGADEIQAIGDNDTRFDQGESLDAIIGLALISCPVVAGETITYTPSYGCDMGNPPSLTACQAGNTNSSGLALDGGTPVLATEVNSDAIGNYIQAYPGIGAAYAEYSEFKLSNIGSGELYNLSFKVGTSQGWNYYPPAAYPRFTWSDFTVSGNAVADDGAGQTDFQFTTDPDGAGVGLEDLDGDGVFDDLAAGQSLVLRNKLTFNHLLGDCAGINPKFDKVRWSYSYDNQCGMRISNNVANNSLGAWNPFSFYSNTYNSELTNISTAGGLNFDSSSTFNLQINYSGGGTISQDNISDLHWRVRLKLPTGIVPDGNGSWQNVANELQFISFDAGTGVAIYETSATSSVGWIVDGVNPQIPLKVDIACTGSTEGYIEWDIEILGSEIDFPGYPATPIKLVCSESPTFSMYCGGDHAIADFSFDRTNYGYKDEDRTIPVTYADVQAANTDADPDNDIHVDRALQGDKVRYHSLVTINNANTTKAQVVLEWDKLDFLDNTAHPNGDGGLKAINIVYHPIGGGPDIICENHDVPSTVANGNVPATDAYSPYTYTADTGGADPKTRITYDLEKLLQAGGCLDGVTLSAGDSFTIDLDFKITETEIDGIYPLFHSLSGLLSYLVEQTAANPTDNISNYLTEDFGVYRIITPAKSPTQSFQIDGCAGDTDGVSMGIVYASYSNIGYLFGNVGANITEYRNYATMKKIELLVPTGLTYELGSSEVVVADRISATGRSQPVSDPTIEYNPPAHPGFHKYTWVNPQYDNNNNNPDWIRPHISAGSGNSVIRFKLKPNCLIEDWQFDINNDGINDSVGIIQLASSEYEIWRNERNAPEPSNYIYSSPKDGVRNWSPLGGATAVYPTDYTPLDYTMSSASPTATVSSTSAAWPLNINFFTAGSSDLSNTWVAIEIPNNNIVPELWDGATQIPLAEYPTAGSGKWWVQIGDLPIGTKNLMIKTNSFTVCGQEDFKVYVGQNCVAYPENPDLGYFNNGVDNTDGYYNCAPQEQTFTLNIQEPSLQMQSTIGGAQDLCENLTSTILVSNTTSSVAYALQETIVLPNNMGIDNSTIKFTYNGVDYPIPAAQITYTASTNTYVFELSQVPGTPISDPNGLPGYNNATGDPSSVALKFDLYTDCGYISGSIIECSVKAKSFCGSYISPFYYSSSVTINGSPDNTSYNVVLAGQEADQTGLLYTCDDTEKFNIHIVNQGAVSTAYEFIDVTIPDSFEYVPNTYVSNTNMPVSPNEPTVTTTAGFTTLKWPVPVGTATGAVLDFDFELRVKSSEIAAMPCPFTTQVDTKVVYDGVITTCVAGNCPVYFEAGSDAKDLVVQKSTLTLATTGITSVYNSGTSEEEVTVNYTLENTSPVEISTTTLEVYLDDDASGDYSVGDTLVQSFANANAIALGATISGSLTYTVDSTDLCSTILVVNTDNNECLCSTVSVPLSTVNTTSGFTVGNQSICYNDPIDIGATAVTGYTYSWTSSNTANNAYLNDLTSSNPTFTYTGAAVTSPTDIDYTVTINRGGCPSSTETITITLKPIANMPTGNSPQFFCSADNPVGSDLVATVLPGYDLTWTHEDGSLVLPTEALVDGETYYVSQEATGGGCPSFNLEIDAVVYDPNRAIGLTDQIFCPSGEIIRIEAIEVFASLDTDTIVWYDSPTGGVILDESTLLIDGVTYYAEIVSAQGCSSLTRLPVTVTLDCGEMIIPKFFTPDNDDYNNTWNVTDYTGKVTGIKIFDRYGKLLKVLQANTTGWDGRYNGRELYADSYWYLIEKNDGTVIRGYFLLKR